MLAIESEEKKYEEMKTVMWPEMKLFYCNRGVASENNAESVAISASAQSMASAMTLNRR
jgi:hypothetical protein